MLFKEFVSTKALESKLPFDIDFEITPDFGSVTTASVGGYDIPTFNELLSRECWFYELLGSQLSNRRQDLQIQLTLLSQELKSKCGLERLGDALSLLLGSVPEGAEPKKKKELQAILDSTDYENFLLANTQELHKLGEMNKLIDDDITINWLKVTFFMLSRYSGEWTLGKTAALPTSRINEIVAFIAKESNGGKEPELLALPASEEDTEDAGK